MNNASFKIGDRVSQEGRGGGRIEDISDERQEALVDFDDSVKVGMVVVPYKHLTLKNAADPERVAKCKARIAEYDARAKDVKNLPEDRTQSGLIRDQWQKELDGLERKNAADHVAFHDPDGDGLACMCKGAMVGVMGPDSKSLTCGQCHAAVSTGDLKIWDGTKYNSAIIPDGSKVRVEDFGGKDGTVVRYDKGDPGGSPFYIVDIGTARSEKVEVSKVRLLNAVTNSSCPGCGQKGLKSESDLGFCEECNRHLCFDCLSNFGGATLCRDCEKKGKGEKKNARPSHDKNAKQSIDRGGRSFGSITESEAPNEAALREALIRKGAMTSEEAKTAKFFVSDKGVGFEFPGGEFVHVRCYCDACYNSLSNSADKKLVLEQIKQVEDLLSTKRAKLATLVAADQEGSEEAAQLVADVNTQETVLAGLRRELGNSSPLGGSTCSDCQRGKLRLIIGENHRYKCDLCATVFRDDVKNAAMGPMEAWERKIVDRTKLLREIGKEEGLATQEWGSLPHDVQIAISDALAQKEAPNLIIGNSEGVARGSKMFVNSLTPGGEKSDAGVFRIGQGVQLKSAPDRVRGSIAQVSGSDAYTVYTLSGQYMGPYGGKELELTEKSQEDKEDPRRANSRKNGLAPTYKFDFEQPEGHTFRGTIRTPGTVECECGKSFRCATVYEGEAWYESHVRPMLKNDNGVDLGGWAQPDDAPGPKCACGHAGGLHGEVAAGAKDPRCCAQGCNCKSFTADTHAPHLVNDGLAKGLSKYGKKA